MARRISSYHSATHRQSWQWVLATVALVMLFLLQACAGTGDDAAGGQGDDAAGGQRDLLQVIRDRGYANVGTYIYPPMAYFEGDKWVGIVPAITREVLGRMGIEDLNVVVVSPVAYVPAVDSGRVDFFPSLSLTPEREEAAEFSDTHLYLPDAVVVRADDTTIEELTDLTGKVIGLTRGSYQETLALDLIDRGVFEPSDIRTYDTYEAPVLDVQTGRVDAAFYDLVGGEYIDQVNPDLDIKVIFVPPEATDRSEYDSSNFMFSKSGTAEFKALVNETLAEIRSDGTLERILKEEGFGDYVDLMIQGADG